MFSSAGGGSSTPKNATKGSDGGGNLGNKMSSPAVLMVVEGSGR